MTTSAGYGALVRHNRSFRLLWIGQIISLLGDWFDLIASAALVARLTGSGTAIGGLFVVRMLAPFVVTPLAGVWADHYNRKWLLVATDLGRAVIVLGFLLVRRPEDVWLLYVCTALQLALSGIYFPARTAILPDVVRPAELGAANALSSGTWSVMLALGAALGGLAAGQWGVYLSFVIDSITFVISAACVSRVSYRPPAAPSAAARPGWLETYVDGLRYLRQHPDVLMITSLKALMGLSISGGFQVLQVDLARRLFPIGQEGGISLGLLYAAVGLGTGVGPMAARYWTGDRDQPLRRAIALAYGVSTAGLLLVTPLWGFGWVLLGTLLRGLGNGTNWVFSSQLLFQHVPAPMRGRVFSTEFALQTLATAASAGLAGRAMDLGAGAPELLWAMIISTLVFGAVWATWLIRLRQAGPGDGR